MKTVKKYAPVLWYILFALHCVLPLGVLLYLIAGYTVKPRDPVLLSVICAVIAAAGAAATFLKGEWKLPLPCRILIAALPGVTAVNWVILPFASPITGGRSAVIFLAMLISLGCAMVTVARTALPAVLKTVILTLAALSVLPLAPYWTFIHLLINFGQNTVVETVPSPAGTYYAEVIDSDQGALGGNTFVNVCEKSIGTLLFRIGRAPRRLYTGPWGAWQSLDVYWKDDGCLVIGSREYEIQ